MTETANMSLEELRTLAKNESLSLTPEELDLLIEVLNSEKEREEAYT